MESHGAARSRPAILRWMAVVRAFAVETVLEWIEDRGPERGAALAFYVILSLGPLMALLMALLQLLAHENQVEPLVMDAVSRFGGQRAAETAQTVLAEVTPPDLLSPQSILTVATLGFAATAAFANIRGALNAMWGIEPEDETFKEQVIGFLRTRWRGFLMIGFTGIIVVLSFLVTSLATVLYDIARAWAPFKLEVAWLIDIGVSLLVIGLLFGVLFRTLPGTRIEWSTVWVGAFGTAALFVLGKVVIARLLANAQWTSYYGPGTSVVAFLAWVYFSAQVFFLGAEFTQVWSRRRGGVLDKTLSQGE